MGFWLPPFESFEFHRIRSIPHGSFPPPKQWNGEILLHVPGVPIPLPPKSRDHWPTSSAQAPTVRNSGVGRWHHWSWHSHISKQIWCIYGAIASTNMMSLAFLGCMECSSRSHTTCCFGNWFIPMRTVLFSLPAMLLMLKWQPRQADKRADFDSLISVIVRASFIHNSMQLANWIYTCIMISINTWT